MSYNDLTSCFPTSFGMDRFGTVLSARSVDLCTVGASAWCRSSLGSEVQDTSQQSFTAGFYPPECATFDALREKVRGESIRTNARFNGR